MNPFFVILVLFSSLSIVALADYDVTNDVIKSMRRSTSYPDFLGKCQNQCAVGGGYSVSFATTRRGTKTSINRAKTKCMCKGASKPRSSSMKKRAPVSKKLSKKSSKASMSNSKKKRAFMNRKRKRKGPPKKAEKEPSLRDFRSKLYKEHNILRKKNSAKSLKVDKRLESRAQKWAEKLAKDGTFVHSHTEGEGENLAFSGGRWIDGNLPVDSWYAEQKDYCRIGKPRFDQKTGHFTQVVWKGTKRVGCGRATSESGKKTYTVCRYSPPGNMNAPKYFKDNVRARC